ncbi:uncharacterized protein R102.4-like isoform X1 [Ambystoma mexicanum]|uniref:uncharacterized protein R102.4-like isoform X1 n=1 Tax=Ambystoma mexicanum TaxID=8296 RepID=UPI0037E86527
MLFPKSGTGIVHLKGSDLGVCPSPSPTSLEIEVPVAVLAVTQAMAGRLLLHRCRTLCRRGNATSKSPEALRSPAPTAVWPSPPEAPEATEAPEYPHSRAPDSIAEVATVFTAHGFSRCVKPRRNVSLAYRSWAPAMSRGPGSAALQRPAPSCTCLSTPECEVSHSPPHPCPTVCALPRTHPSLTPNISESVAPSRTLPLDGSSAFSIGTADSKLGTIAPVSPTSCGPNLRCPPLALAPPCGFLDLSLLLQVVPPRTSSGEGRTQHQPINVVSCGPCMCRTRTASRIPFRKALGPMIPFTAGASGCPAVRFYYKSASRSDGSQEPYQVVDLRSDTLSTPSTEMMSAMVHAEVGDDVYGEDPTVNELQQRAAQLFGTEDALFVPSGTMGNLVSVMCHCRRRGEELLLGDHAHIHLYEQGGVAQVAGVSPRLVRNLPDGRLDLEDLESKIQHGYPDPHYPHTRLICLENTHNRAGGRVLPLAHLLEVRLLADRHGLAVHLDGARVMNAAVALGVAPAQIVQHCNSVSMCLSKGLSAPVGAVIGGSREFIMECLRVRKVLGGGMRQAGVLAAPGLVALARAEETLREDHRRAKKFAKGVKELSSSVCSVDLSSVETNMVMLSVDDPRVSPQEFCDRMWEVSEEDILAIGHGVRVRMFVMYKRTVRLVWYRNISEEDTDMALKKLKFVVQKYREELKIM